MPLKEITNSLDTIIGLCENPITLDDMDDMITDILRLKNWTPGQRRIRYEKAEELIPEKIKRINYLGNMVAKSRDISKRCGLDYSEIVEGDVNLIKAGIADYYLNQIKA
jgi:hypothetical protein